MRGLFYVASVFVASLQTAAQSRDPEETTALDAAGSARKSASPLLSPMVKALRFQQLT